MLIVVQNRTALLPTSPSVILYTKITTAVLASLSVVIFFLSFTCDKVDRTTQIKSTWDRLWSSLSLDICEVVYPADS